MYKCLFYPKRWDVSTSWEEASVFKTLEDICTKFTDKYRLPFPIFPLFVLVFFSELRHKDRNLRNIACYVGTKPSRFPSSTPPPHPTPQKRTLCVIPLNCVTPNTHGPANFPPVETLPEKVVSFFLHSSSPADVRAVRCYCDG